MLYDSAFSCDACITLSSFVRFSDVSGNKKNTKDCFDMKPIVFALSSFYFVLILIYFGITIVSSCRYARLCFVMLINAAGLLF